MTSLSWILEVLWLNWCLSFIFLVGRAHNLRNNPPKFQLGLLTLIQTRYLYSTCAVLLPLKCISFFLAPQKALKNEQRFSFSPLSLLSSTSHCLALCQTPLSRSRLSGEQDLLFVCYHCGHSHKHSDTQTYFRPVPCGWGSFISTKLYGCPRGASTSTSPVGGWVLPPSGNLLNPLRHCCLFSDCPNLSGATSRPRGVHNSLFSTHIQVDFTWGRCVFPPCAVCSNSSYGHVKCTGVNKLLLSSNSRTFWGFIYLFLRRSDCQLVHGWQVYLINPA